MRECRRPAARPNPLPSRLVVLWLLALGAAADAQAQAAGDPVYRCGNSYSSKPCPGAAVVDAADPRSAAQQREASQAAQRDAALAKQMRADRLAAEHAAPKGGAANVGPVAAKPPAPAASKPHHASKAKKPGKPAASKAAKPAASASAR
jgi:hypothetical protein